MKIKTYLALSLLVMNICYAQKATVQVKLVDSLASDASGFTFQVLVKNDSFDVYWVKDTTYLQDHVEDQYNFLIYTIISKLTKGGIYKQYDSFVHGGDPGSDSHFLDSCTDCLILRKGESLKFNIKLLKCCIMDSGQYRLEVYIAPPLMTCKRCEQIGELYSPSIYFSVPLWARTRRRPR